MWYKPSLFICHPSANFVDAISLFKLATYYIFHDRKGGRVIKQFLLESGQIVVYENFWNQVTLVSLFEARLDPVRQKEVFETVKGVVLG